MGVGHRDVTAAARDRQRWRDRETEGETAHCSACQLAGTAKPPETPGSGHCPESRFALGAVPTGLQGHRDGEIAGKGETVGEMEGQRDRDREDPPRSCCDPHPDLCPKPAPH